MVFGVIADAQYCDCPPYLNRYYRASLGKMHNATDALDAAHVDFAVHLGDLIDRDFESFEPINDAFLTLEAPTYHVLGNHEYSVRLEWQDDVLDELGLETRYSSISKGAWRFIFLDGNDLSLYSTRRGSPRRLEAERMYAALDAADAPNAQTWNGGIGQNQLDWLDRTLADAQGQGQNVLVFSHFPIYPMSVYALWNAEEVRTLIESYPNVVAYMNGHNHDGLVATHGGIHYISLKGMVETKTSNAFAAVSLHSDRIDIRGYGREPSRTLALVPDPADRIVSSGRILLDRDRAVED
ncbi:MAG: metallophosphoesterase [Rubricoccaceae bacterium]